jgi:hypothetical protein
VNARENNINFQLMADFKCALNKLRLNGSSAQVDELVINDLDARMLVSARKLENLATSEERRRPDQCPRPLLT